jgi:hypothetical protein
MMEEMAAVMVVKSAFSAIFIAVPPRASQPRPGARLVIAPVTDLRSAAPRKPCTPS